MKKWIAAARLRTLPLAFSCILLGTFIAAYDGAFDGLILALCLVTTLLYQVLSNFANDYGDGVKGTDKNRKGELRAVASGEITAYQMKRAVYIFAFLAFVSGTGLSILGTRNAPNYITIIFIALGLLAIWAAIRYTVGKSAYGYKGMGDVYVLLFFGWLGVMGSYFMQTNNINFLVLLPASAIGMLAAGVLNLNNMRDREDDENAGKITLAVRLGAQKAKHYQSFLIIGALLLSLIYIGLEGSSFWSYLFVLSAPLILITLIKSHKAKSPEEFDPLLKPLALSTLIYSLLFGVGLILSM